MKGLIIFIILLSVSSLSFARPVIPVGSADDSQQNQTQNSVVQPQNKTAKKKDIFTSKELWDINGKTPPKIVLDFLENPTPETARRYLEWNKERAEKIDKAMALLEQIRQQKIKNKLKKIPLSRINNSRIVMFFSPTCPYCLRELSVIKQIKNDYPQVGISLYPINNPFLAEERLNGLGLGKYLSYSDKNSKIAKQVTAIPFIVVEDKNGNKVKAEFTGETSYEKIIGSM